MLRAYWVISSLISSWTWEKQRGLLVYGDLTLLIEGRFKWLAGRHFSMIHNGFTAFNLASPRMAEIFRNHH